MLWTLIIQLRTLLRYHFPDIAPTYSRKKEKLLNFNLVKGRHNLLPTLCSNELCFLRRNFLQKNILFSHFYAKMPGSINHQQDIPKCFACSFPCSASSYYYCCCYTYLTFNFRGITLGENLSPDFLVNEEKVKPRKGSFFKK